MNEEEKKAIKVLKINPEIIADLDEELLYKMFEFEGQSIKELKKWAYKIVLNLITKLQKENEEKDKIIYEIARSNVKLKGYEIEEKYIDTTIRFFTKYVKNLERNPQWRNDKNE